MKLEVKKVTKEMAEQLLEGHVNLRPYNKMLSFQMRKDIIKGEFNKDDANVCLKEDGSLYYGQHILHAIIDENPAEGIELNVYQLENTKDDRHHRPGYLNRESKYKYTLPNRRHIKH